MTPAEQPVVVVGGGFAALEMALALRVQRPDLPVTVIRPEPGLIFRPWLIRLPAGGAPPPSIPFDQLVKAAGAHIIEGRATSVDLEARSVRLESGKGIPYSELVVASGAVADRRRIPGALEHALFPCEMEDAQEFAGRVANSPGRVAVVFGWERAGPGLEYAAWIAAHRPGVRVTAIDGDATLARRFGPRATAHLSALFERRGARLIAEEPVDRIDEKSVGLGERTIPADVIAVATPLRGATDWLPPALVDGRGMLLVDESMRAAAGVWGAGDVVSVPAGYRHPPALRSIQATAPRIARNVVADLDGRAAKPVLRAGRPDMALPDLAGRAILVRQGRLILSGRLPLWIRSRSEHRYLRSRGVQAR